MKSLDCGCKKTEDLVRDSLVWYICFYGNHYSVGWTFKYTL